MALENDALSVTTAEESPRPLLVFSCGGAYLSICVQPPHQL